MDIHDCNWDKDLAYQSDTVRKEKFTQAINKARLLYEKIEIHPKCLVAILFNGDDIAKSDTTVMYMNNSDMLIHTHNPKYDYFVMDHEFKDVCMAIGMDNSKQKGAEILWGLARFDGTVILEPIYFGTHNIQNKFIYATAGRYEDGHKLFDYNGKLVMDFPGKRPYCELKGDFIINNELTHIISYSVDNPSYLEELSKITKVYVIYRGEIYFLTEITSATTWLYTRDKNVVLKVSRDIFSKDTREVVFTGKDIMSKAKRLEV